MAKLKYITILLQVKVYSLHFSLMLKVLWLIMRNAKTGLSMQTCTTYRLVAKSRQYVILIRNIFRECEVFMLRGQGDMEIFFLDCRGQQQDKG